MELRTAPYTPDLVLQKLRGEAICRFESKLKPKTRLDFLDKLLCAGRVSVPLYPEARIYEGPWYYQGDEPTCAAWAVVHGALVAGVENDPGLIAKLLNLATGQTDPKNLGLKRSQLITEVRGHDSQLELIEPVGQRQLMASGWHRRRLEYNGEFIKDCLDRSQAVLVSLNGPYYKTRDNSLHKVCVCGYRVTDRGVMNVQLIDSNWGVLWTSLEHLSSAVVDRTSLVLAKKP